MALPLLPLALGALAGAAAAYIYNSQDARMRARGAVDAARRGMAGYRARSYSPPLNPGADFEPVENTTTLEERIP